MNYWERFVMATKAAYTSFRREIMSADINDQTADSDWKLTESRRLRYEILWRIFQGTAFDETNQWVRQFKKKYGLYKWVRDLINPAFELGEFYSSNLWGGRLEMYGEDYDLSAQPGGAIPILTTDDNLRTAVATLWNHSNWSTKKDLVPLLGAVLGDVVIEAYNDRRKMRMELRIHNPGDFEIVMFDPMGNVKGYDICYQRTDDINPEREVEYKEVVRREQRDGRVVVVYRTFKDGSPYSWGNSNMVYDSMGNLVREEDVSEWYTDYDFVPLVWVPHRDIGMHFGQSELQAKIGLLIEIENILSNVNDQIMKIVNAKWVALGASRPKVTQSPNAAAVEAGSDRDLNDQEGRAKSTIIYIPEEGATLQALIEQLDIPGALSSVDMMIQNLEKALPELGLTRIMIQDTDLSGRAMRNQQRRPARKVEARRAMYDEKLVQVQQMAIAIGGHERYKGYEAFSLESYEAGDLFHLVGDRPVFDSDPLDRAELVKAKADNLKLLSEMTTLKVAAEISEYAQEEIDMIVEADMGFSTPLPDDIDDDNDDDELIAPTDEEEDDGQG